MKKIQLILLSALILTLSSCQLVGDIFKTGVGVGVFLVVAVVAIIIFVAAKVGGK